MRRDALVLASGKRPPLPQIDLDINLLERKTGGMGAGGGLSAAAAGEGGFPGLVGSFSYSEKNLFGLNQRLSARVELGQVGVRGGSTRPRVNGQGRGPFHVVTFGPKTHPDPPCLTLRLHSPHGP